MKNRKTTKFLSLLLAFIMMLSIAPFNGLGELFKTTASAVDVVEGYYTYSISSGVAYIKKVATEISGNITVPSVTNEGTQVIGISYGAFYNCVNLTGVTVPQGIETIVSQAFGNCTQLKTISLPDSVKLIGQNAFLGTGYYNDISNWDGSGVLYIGKHLIESKKEISGGYTINPGTITVATNAFENCTNLKKVIVPTSVKNIGYNAFRYCTSLEEIAVYEDNPNYIDIEGVLYTKDKKRLIQYPIGNKRENYSVSNGVTFVESYAFSKCPYLKKVTLPEGITEFSYNIFADCTSLTSVVLPNSTRVIHDGLFKNCTSLTKIAIPFGIKIIGNNTFDGCSALKSITLAHTIVDIYSDSFVGCNALKNVYFAGTQTEWNAIKTYNNNGKLTGAENILFGENLVEGPYTYKIETYKNPRTAVITGVDKETKAAAKIPSTICGYSVTGIGAGAFADCDLIASLTIPKSVTYIGAGAFDGCTALTDVYYPGTQAEWNAITGEEALADKTIHFGQEDPNDPDPEIPDDPEVPEDPEVPGGDDYANAKLPEITSKTARYKNNLTVKITATGIPATGFLVVDGTKIAPDATGTATFETQYQATATRSFKAHIEDKDGNIKVAQKEYKVEVSTGFFAKLSAFFTDFLFNGFKWKNATIEF